MDSQLEVTQAKANLAQAEATEREQNHQKQLAELARVRASLRAAMARYSELAGEITARRTVFEQLRTELKRAIELVTQSTEARPRIAAILPDDPETVAWRTRHEKLERQRDAIIAKLHAAPSPDEYQIEVARYTGETGIIATLERAHANLLRQLDPDEHRRFLEGGVFHVG